MLFHIFTKFTRQITSTLMSKNDSKFSVSAKAPCFTSIWQQLKFLFFTLKDSFVEAITSFKAHESWFCNEWKCKRNKRKNVLDFHTIPADKFAMHFSFCIYYDMGCWENERKWKRYNFMSEERLESATFYLRKLREFGEKWRRYFHSGDYT